MPSSDPYATLPRHSATCICRRCRDARRRAEFEASVPGGGARLLRRGERAHPPADPVGLETGRDRRRRRGHPRRSAPRRSAWSCPVREAALRNGAFAPPGGRPWCTPGQVAPAWARDCARDSVFPPTGLSRMPLFTGRARPSPQHSGAEGSALEYPTLGRPSNCAPLAGRPANPSCTQSTGAPGNRLHVARSSAVLNGCRGERRGRPHPKGWSRADTEEQPRRPNLLLGRSE